MRTTKNINTLNFTFPSTLYPQGWYTCPVCGEKFEANDNTRFMIGDEYTCSWKCFAIENKRLSAEKSSDDSHKRGRKPKKTMQNNEIYKGEKND